MKTIKFLLATLFIGSVVFLVACGDDDDPVQAGPLNLVSITAIGTSINTGEDVSRPLAAEATTSNVPVDAKIEVVFSKNVDAATATSTNVTLTQGGSAVSTTVATSGSTVTVTPAAALAQDTEYTLTLTSAIKGSDGGIFTQATRTFKTEIEDEEPIEDGLLAHFKFEDNADDLTGNYDATSISNITYVASRNAAAGKAASFNGETSIIEIPNADEFLTHGSFTLSLWVKADGSKTAHFVVGLAAWHGFQFEIMGGEWDSPTKGVKLAARYELENGTFVSEDNWWNGNANTWQGSEFALDISGETPPGVGQYFMDVWAHVVYTYNASTKTGASYVNGMKTRQWNFNLWPEADGKRTAVGVGFSGNTTDGGNNLALGFIQATGNPIVADGWANFATGTNQFKGLLDDVRIYGKALTEAEVQTQYDAEKP
ncbi:MAG: Ig-like domain-containing protein [Cyclobacteriaceae bacterium]|nr:Ig-like domain-containing protein [Cyclobacteriaceae bacterium]